MPGTVHFGWFAPAGDRGWERIQPESFRADLARVLEVVGETFSSVWVSDHPMAGEKFRLECWTLLTWIAAQAPTLSIGPIVLSNPYRHPPLVAKMAASLQSLTSGQVVLGYGTGWDEVEFQAYGYDFPPTVDRVARLVEGIEVMRALWAEQPANYAGQHYRLANAYGVPVPAPRPPVMVGGGGERHLLRAVASHADWWNTVPLPLPAAAHKLDVLRRHCDTVGRDYETIRKTFMLCVVLGRTDEEARQRAAMVRQPQEHGFVGTPAALCRQLAALTALGFDLFQLAFPGFPGTDDIELFDRAVRPEFG